MDFILQSPTYKTFLENSDSEILDLTELNIDPIYFKEDLSINNLSDFKQVIGICRYWGITFPESIYDYMFDNAFDCLEYLFSINKDQLEIKNLINNFLSIINVANDNLREITKTSLYLRRISLTPTPQFIENCRTNKKAVFEFFYFFVNGINKKFLPEVSTHYLSVNEEHHLSPFPLIFEYDDKFNIYFYYQKDNMESELLNGENKSSEWKNIIKQEYINYFKIDYMIYLKELHIFFCRFNEELKKNGISNLNIEMYGDDDASPALFFSLADIKRIE